MLTDSFMCWVSQKKTNLFFYASVIRFWHSCLFCSVYFLFCAFHVSFHVTVGLHGSDGPLPTLQKVLAAADF